MKMNNGYLDKSLVQNSLLACTLLTHFIKKYENLNSYTDNVDLLKLLLVLPIVWHKESCNLICKRKTALLHKPISKGLFHNIILR